MFVYMGNVYTDQRSYYTKAKLDFGACHLKPCVHLHTGAQYILIRK